MSPAGGTQDPIDRGRAWLVGIAVGALAVAALVVAFVIGTNYSDEPTPVAGTEKQATPDLPKAVSGPGKDLFIASCGSCHTISEAGTTGTVGPDLDALKPDAALVSQAIAKGGTGSGMMPPALLSGKEAQQVADYVAAATAGN